MKRFEGPANGMRFKTKDQNRTPKSSRPDANPFLPCFHFRRLVWDTALISASCFQRVLIIMQQS
jgi:hypothetical protein